LISGYLEFLYGLLRPWRKRFRQAFAIIVVISATAAAVSLSLSLGSAMLWRALPVASPGELFYVEVLPSGLDAALFPLWRTIRGEFRDFVSYTPDRSTVVILQGVPRQVSVVHATGAFFGVLGVRPVLGRVFTEDDVSAGRFQLAVLSHRAWMRLFAGDPQVVGNTVELLQGSTETQRVQIIGVLPPEFEVAPGRSVDVYQPLTDGVPPAVVSSRLRHNQRDVIARLRPSAEMNDTEAYLRKRHASFVKAAGTMRPRAVNLVPLHEVLFGSARPLTRMLSAATILVVVSGLATSLGLMLSIATERRREIGVRRALGATDWHLVRRGLAEAAVLAVVAVIAALVAAQLLLTILLTVAPPDIARLDGARIGWREGLLAIGIASASMVLFASVPVTVRAGGIASITRTGLGTATESKRELFARLAVATAQVAVVTALVVPAQVTIDAFRRFVSQPLGFSFDKLLEAEVILPNDYVDPSSSVALVHALRRLAFSVSGIQAAAVVQSLPLDRVSEILLFFADGSRAWTPSTQITPGYFHTLNIPLRSGRDFIQRDGLDTAIISEALAKKYFGNAFNAVGKHLEYGRPPGVEIIGVAPDVRQSVLATPMGPMIYRPVTSSNRSFFILARTKDSPELSANGLAKAIRSVNPLMLVTVRPFELRFRDHTARARLLAYGVSSVAFLTLGIAVAGSYALASYLFSRQSKALGIRIALGAPPWQAASRVILRGVAPLMAGVMMGVPLAYVIVNRLGAEIASSQKVTPLTWTISICSVLSVLVVAMYRPLHLALRTNPARVLRED
jgi:putative ABC transport system permease protein